MRPGVHLRIAHLSDPHFGTIVPAVRDALLAELLAQPPDLILITGDITQRARREQFVQAREFLDALPRVPRLCLPGNHDLPLFDVMARAIKPYDYYRCYIGKELEPTYVDDRIAVLCIDATSRLRHKDGALGAQQIKHAAANLVQMDRPFRLVATHQPLAAAVGSDLRNVAHGATQALDSWMTAGADLFLGGHIHLPYCLEVRTSNHRESAVLLQAGTCLSHRVRDGIANSWNLVTLVQVGGERRMHIQRRDYDASSGRFIVARLHEAVSMMDRRRTGLNGWRLGAQP